MLIHIILDGGSYFNNVGHGLPRGECIDHGVDNQDHGTSITSYTLDKSSSYVTVTSSSTVVKTGSITLTKGNSTVQMTELNSSYYLLGPFVVNCNNNNGYTVTVLDGNKNVISGARTCNSSGTNITVRGSATFYIKIPVAAAANGIYSVTLENTATVTATRSITVKAYGVYNPDRGEQYQRVGVTVYKEDTETTTTTDTKSVTWKDFNGILEIIKQDADNSSINLSGVKIRVQNSTTGYDKTFTTDSNGKIRITNLPVGTYTITEVENGNYGYATIESGKTTVSAGKVTTFTLKNEKQTGNLRIIKTDANDTQYPLAGVSFRIQNSSGQYIIAVDNSGNVQREVTGEIHLGNLQTTSDVSQATVFITNSAGIVNIYNLLTGTYTVSEVSVGDNFGYEVDSSCVTWVSNLVDSSQQGTVGTIQVNRQTSTNTGTSSSGTENLFNRIFFRNTRVYIKLRGYAWEDKVDGKSSTRDDQYLEDSSDERLANIPVRLYKANGILLDETVTDENGEYIFGNYDEDTNAIKLKIDDLVGAYIEFEYNGMSYQSLAVNSEFDVSSTEKEVTTTIEKTIDCTRCGGTGIVEETADCSNNILIKYKYMSGTSYCAYYYCEICGYKTSSTSTSHESWIDAMADTSTQTHTGTLIVETTCNTCNGSGTVKVEVETDSETKTTVTVTKLSGNTNKASDEAFRDAFNEEYAIISNGISSDSEGTKTWDIEYTYDEDENTSTVVWGDSNEILYGYEDQKYPISNVYEQYTLTAVTNTSSTNVLCTSLTPTDIRNQKVEEIGGLNLGLYERDRPDLAVVEDVENVQISLNDYTHTYQYAQRYLDPEEYAGGEDIFNVGVRFASKYISNSYSRAVYSSDIISNQTDNPEKLDIRIRYTIKLKNESSSIYSSVNTLVNYYDERYTVISVNDDNGLEREGDYGVITNYGQELEFDTTNYNEEEMNQIIIYANYLLEPGETRELTIEYKLNNDAVNAILNEEQTLDSVTEVYSYSSYTDGNANAPLAGIDVNSNPGTVEIERDDDGNVDITKTIEDDSDKAPSITLYVVEGRVISGTVWEDSAIEDLLELEGYYKERKGDGEYDSTEENVIRNVTVELLTPSDSGGYEVAKLYQKGENVYDDLQVLDATTTTNTQGYYEFSGVIPNNYLIRYTYGDTSVVYNQNGEELYNIDADDYKSTIYRGGDKDAADNMTDYWYRDETSGVDGAARWSDAKDNNDIITSRINGELDGTGETVIKNSTMTESENVFTQISADTRVFDIKMDYDVNLDNISEYGADLKFVFDQIDFGIIERPIQTVTIDKKVANIKIQLANGNSIVDGDPNPPAGETDSPLSYVRVLDDNLVIEIDNELIQGSTLTITYSITVDNSECEIDYDTEDYYIYGEIPANRDQHYLIATVTDIYDYLPAEMVFELDNSTNDDWELISNIQASYNDGYLSEVVYNQVKDLNNIIHLKDTAESKFDLEPASSATSYIVVSRQLSTSNDELYYENDVEIVEYTKRAPTNSTPGNYDPTENTTYGPDPDPDDPDDPDIITISNEPDDDYLTVTIIPPTGSDEIIKYWMYGGLGVTLLIIMVGGIILIKRKVL